MSHDTSIPEIIERGLPNAVIYDLSQPGHVTITLPPNSSWSSGLHWHETHIEYLKVVKGSIFVQLESNFIAVTATTDAQPEIKINRHAWHEWRRAEPDGEVVVVERTDPEDNDKAIFFWNLNGVILDAPKLLSEPVSMLSRFPPQLRGWALDFWITLNLFVIFSYLDNVPVFIDMPGIVRRLGIPTNIAAANIFTVIDVFASRLVLYLSSWVGGILDLKPVRSEYTPQASYQSWWRARSRQWREKQV